MKRESRKARPNRRFANDARQLATLSQHDPTDLSGHNRQCKNGIIVPWQRDSMRR